MPGPHQVIERGPWRTAIVCTFSLVLMGARVARMDDDDARERSLSSSTALPLSLFGWYKADLSLTVLAVRCRHGGY